MFTGMFAAELRVKNAVIPLSLMHLNTSGYGFLRILKYTIIGFTTRATKSITPIKTTSKCTYLRKASIPLVAIASNTRPIIPSGAKFITHLTI
ncbi:hypothetical protein SDC9_186600 [bioreactor metagenome]|uniref:Uncharacterized protein n=1 Tax=bioreactor metagenome TaxID=1076179 RepID=A0A645HSF0_9ZZZZ